MSTLRFFALAALLGSIASGLACSGSVASGQGGSGTSNAAHAPFPTVTNHGIPAMTAPKIVAITFNGDSNAAAIGSYVSSLGATAWWKTVMKDYGVGAGTGQSVATTATFAASYTDDPTGTLADGGTPTMPGFVVSTVTGTPGMPAPDANTIYAFFLPATTSFEIQGASSCKQVGGYHNSTVAGGTTYIYAVIPECAGAKFADRAFGSEIELLSFLSSHEISEAATDPTATLTQTSFAAGWYNDFVDDTADDFAWNLASDGEIADFCVDQFGFKSQNDTATEGATLLQRVWSTSAASAGKNPCVPVPGGEVYFNAAPAEGADLVIAPAANSATTIEVDAFSDAPKSWQLLALDGALVQGQPAALTLSFAGGAPEPQQGLSISAIPAIGVTNGTKAQLSITVVGTLTMTSPFASAYLVSHDGTSLTTASNDHYWPIAVTTQAIAHQIGLDAHAAHAQISLHGGPRLHRAGGSSALRLVP